MPTLGGLATNGAGSNYGISYFSGVLEAREADLGPTDLYVTPIVPDASFFTDAGAAGEQGLSLRDLTEGQDWLLKRIVGKLSVNVPNIVKTVNTAPYLFQVGAGFFVGRADDANENIPDSSNAEIDPLGVQNIRQPWIWRRTWLLRNSGQPVPTLGFNEVWVPGTNLAYMDHLSGPHLDSKIARRIRREERLWFVINAYGKDFVSDERPASPPYATVGTVEFSLDYRILGAMRRSTNKSTF